MFLIFISLFARADYFELDQRVRSEEAARSAAEAQVQTTRDVADHNARLQGVVDGFSRAHRGYSNLRATGCADLCMWNGRIMNRQPDFIQTLTFDTGDGYECYARLYPAGKEVACLHPQTHERIYIDPLAHLRGPEKKERHPRRRG